MRWVEKHIFSGYYFCRGNNKTEKKSTHHKPSIKGLSHIPQRALSGRSLQLGTGRVHELLKKVAALEKEERFDRAQTREQLLLVEQQREQGVTRVLSVSERWRLDGWRGKGLMRKMSG